MRKLIFTFTLIIAAFLSISAQITFTVSGYVTSSNTNLAVPNHTVNISIFDSASTFTYQSTTTTNNNGYYSFTVSGNAVMPIISVYTMNCQNQNVYQYVWSSPYTANFNICTSSSTPCASSFIIMPDSGNANLFHFYNTSTGNPTSFSWNFGDGTTSSLQNPSHTFANGYYIVSLTISGTNCQSTYYDSIIVNNGSSGSNCQAGFTYTISPNNPLQVNFTNTSTGNSLTYNWSFGNTNYSSAVNPTMTYSAAGTYTVILTASNSTCSSTYNATITLTNPSGGCQSSFQTYQDSVNPYTFYFYNTSTGNPTSFLWNFGDNTTSSQQYPTHTYNSPGYYMVSLTVSGNGCQSVSYDTIYVGSALPCQASFSYQTTGNTVQFYNTSTGNPTSFMWSFGDGTSSTAMNPSHSFAQAGTYNVTLTIFGSSCQNSTTQTISLNTSASYSLAGNVTAGGLAVYQGSVMLFDNNSNIISSTNLDSAGHYYFGNLAAGTYKIYALPAPNSSFAYGYMPTYYTSTINWITASSVNLTANVWNINISLVSVIPNAGGNGSVSGNIFPGAKSSVENLNINLLNASNQPVRNTKTDLNGHYTFANLAYGDYKITVEVAGKTSDVISVNLSQENPNSGSNNFQTGTNSYTAVTAINENFLETSSLYPNPTTGKLFVEFNTSKSMNIELQVFDNLGNLVKENYLQSVNSINKIVLDLSDLPKGIYTMRMLDTNGQLATRMIIKL